MIQTEHYKFILTPIMDIMEDAFIASENVGYNMEDYPLSEYLFQSIFLKMTGFMEQKCKCICWDLATINYNFRKTFLREKATDMFSDYSSKNFTYKALLDQLKLLGLEKKIDEEKMGQEIEKITTKFESLSRKFDFFYLNDKEYHDYRVVRAEIKASHFATDTSFFEWKDLFDLMIDHRNRCAHNTLSYQTELPSLKTLQNNIFKFQNYFLFFYLLTLIDFEFIELYKQSMQKRY